MDLKNIPEQDLDQLLMTLESFSRKSPLDYVPHPANPLTGFGGMKLFHCSPKRVRIIFGGNQSGKTVSGAIELLFHATGLYPEWYPKDKRYSRPIKARIIGEDYTKWGKVLEDKIKEYLPKELLIHEGRTMRRALESLEIRHTSGGISSIDIMTHEQDDGVFESWTGDLAWFDEPPPQAKYVATIRGLMAQGGRAIFTLTPLKEPWLYDAFVLNEDEYTEHWNVDLEDNPHLTRANKDFWISQMTEDEKDARIHGKFRHLVGRVYKDFDEHIHILSKDKIKLDKSWSLFFALDPHPRKPHFGIWAMINPLGTIYVIDSLEFKGTIHEVSKLILLKEKMMGRNPEDTTRIIDPNRGRTPSEVTGLRVVEEFAKEGLYFIDNVNDDVDLGHMLVQQRLSWDKTKPISSSNCPSLYVFKETCQGVIKSFLTYVWSEFKGSLKDEKGVKEKPKDIEKDFMDCVRYLVVYNPIWIDPRDRDEPVQINNISGWLS